MKRTYKVRYAFAGHEKGASVTDADFATGVNTQALVDGGMLTVTDTEAVACPACVEQEMKRPFKAKSVEEMTEHYTDKHAGLQPPDEEDLSNG